MFKKNQFLFLLFFSTIICGQNQINSIQDSINKYYSKDFTKAKSFCKKLEKKINHTDNAELKIINYCYLADLSNAMFQKDSVLYYYDKGMEIATNSGEIKNELIVSINKANYFNSSFDFERALTIYDDCLKIALKINDSYTVSHIRMQKANILYELEKYDESLSNYKKSLEYANLSSNDILNNKIGLIKSYLKTNKPDSVYYFIDESLKLSKKERNKSFEILLLKEYSLYYRLKKDYKQSEKVIDDAISLANKIKNESILSELILSKAELLAVVKRNAESIELLVDLLEKKEKSLQPEQLCQVYYILSENYKEVKDLNNSNKYLGLYIECSKKIGQKKIDAIDHLHKIDISELQNREASLINQKWGLFSIVLFLFGIVLLIYMNKKGVEKQNQLKFEELLFKIRNYEEETKNTQLSGSNEAIISSLHERDVFVDQSKEDLEIENEVIVDEFTEDIEEINETTDEELLVDGLEAQNSNSSFNIKDETVAEILEKLIKLEEKKQFLRQDFTLHNVAKKLKTNTAYLSKIINSELGKSFSTYANELRINYIILELKNNAKLRSYSINAIAEEIGYKSPESFTKYFKAATGISPSVYIKKINEIK